MSDRVAELRDYLSPDTPAAWISNLWIDYNNQRGGKLAEWEELRNYIFATDTSTTSNNKLPWKNSTTLPKLCQIRDNLHSNYLSALFPNDDWLVWEGYSQEDSIKKKRDAIQAYMRNKTREGHFRIEMSKLLYDYIDYGNAFATVSFESRYKEMPDGSRIAGYIGPKIHRISPLDIVFNPAANNFINSYKVIRSIKTVGEIKKMAEDEPENASLASAMARRELLSVNLGGYSRDDFQKAVGYSVDGFGDLLTYYSSGYVELLEFYGDYHDHVTGELKRNQVITIMDRCHTIRQQDIPSWFGHAPIYHVGWRLRPDNLWAMGPLDNLVGMQYRIDHLENLKADAMDLSVHPPLVISGEVEEFEYGPGVEIHIDSDGSIQELGKNLNGVIAAANEIEQLEARMELYAGAPREAMGVRSPGEKTMFEVAQLQNAAGRIFQEKINMFELELVEPSLNGMFESSKRNMDSFDIIRVMDDDLGVQQILEVTREDITAAGKLRPIGARHFATQAQLIQNLTGIFNSTVGQLITPHTSSIQMAALLEDAMGLAKYKLFKPNVAVFEQQETQRLMNQAQEDLAVEGGTPAQGAVPAGVPQ